MIKSRTFDVELAEKFGLNNAIFLQDIAYWIEFNRKNDTAFKDGRYWTYSTMNELAERHPYWNKNQVRHIVDTCKKNGWIIVEHYDKSSYNRRNWYSLSDEIMSIISYDSVPGSKEKINHTDKKNISNREEEIPSSYNNNIYTKDISIKDNKEKEIKKETRIQPLSYNQEKEDYGFGTELEEAINDWLAYKQERREPYKPVGLKSLIAQVKKKSQEYGEDAVANLIRECMSSNWKGIIWDRLKPNLLNQSRIATDKEKSFLDIARELEGGKRNDH